MQRKTGLLIFCALSAVVSAALVIVFAWGATRLAHMATRPAGKTLFYVGAAVGTMAGLMFYNAILSVYNVVRLGAGSLEERRPRLIMGAALCALFLVILGGSYYFLRSERVLWNPAAVRLQKEPAAEAPTPGGMPSEPEKKPDTQDTNAGNESEK